MQARLRIRQVLGWVVTAIFVAGFFFNPIGEWTGAIMGVWFAGTQNLRRAFLWLLAIALIPSAIRHWRMLPAHHGVGAALLILAAVLSVLPFLIHRLTSERLSGIAWTLPFPLASLAVAWLSGAWLTAQLPPEFRTFSLATAPTATALLRVFFVGWFAAAVVWLWNREFRLEGATRVFASRSRPWSEQTETVALLRSPVTRTPLRVAGEGHSMRLESTAGESFPIRDGMPVFLRPQDLTGQNSKYNKLYETIGGFYDDSQRVMFALGGLGRDTYVRSYLEPLEVRPGDRVLETSVGTGLNFKYLPREIQRYGIDLSREMLLRCQGNMRRWDMQADLFVGNAEALPFADETFDVVFHVGGINFFSDRAAAIAEMIRVARPGTLLLIADETEEHVKEAYENIPYTREFFKGRSNAVSAPVDLIPAAMEDVRVRILNVAGKNRFYYLTFRKPRATTPLQAAASVCAAAPCEEPVLK